MSQRVGRKPLTTGHVDHLCGSTHAKDRMRIFLETLRGTLTIPDACQLLELSEAQFHHARHVWLQESLELLEPRRVGRPPKQTDPVELSRRCAELETEMEQLRAHAQAAQVREEIARILSNPAGEPGKKTADGMTPFVKPR
jgi:hypothetical protein